MRCREGHAPLTTLSRRVIAAHSRLPQAHWHRNQAADLAAAGCEMASCHIASSHSMHEAPSHHGCAPTGTTHEHSPGCAMPGRMVDDMQGGCGSREPAAARRAPAPDEVGCRCASHISDGQHGLPPGDPEGSSLLAPPPAAAESDGRQRVPRRRASCAGHPKSEDVFDTKNVRIKICDGLEGWFLNVPCGWGGKCLVGGCVW